MLSSTARAGRLLVLGAATLLLAACAAAGRGRVAQDVALQVENDYRPAAQVTVRLVSTGGVRRLLGTVPAAAMRDFGYGEASFAGSYQLLAELPDGRLLTSRGFALFRGATVRWTLFSNTLSVLGP